MIPLRMGLCWACAIVPALVSLSLSMTDARADAVHHDLDIYLDPNSSYFKATDRISFSEFDRNRRLVFHLAPNFQVEAFAEDHGPLTMDRHGDRLWTRNIVDPSQPIEITYRGRLSGVGANDRWLSGPEGVYLPAGSGWLPATTDEESSFRMTITVPDPFRAVVPGRLVFDQLIRGDYRAKFSIDRAFEPPVLFAGPYVIQERFQGSVRLRTYFHPEVADLAETYLNNAARYLDAFTPAIGRYPFDTLKIVSSPLPVGLGFPGIAYVSRRILPLPFMQTRSLAHEILHNWWGNGVFVDYDSGNWAEGLTTYMANHAIATTEGRAKARLMRASWLRDYAALPKSVDIPVSGFRARGHDASQILGYNKIAMVFHMLRQEIGEAAF
ncbi:MAG: M1 family peptidase, partial [Rhodospirillales bacterium]|nr:M1 family peptidase [Rhodospirillales bacterium]